MYGLVCIFARLYSAKHMYQIAIEFMEMKSLYAHTEIEWQHLKWCLCICALSTAVLLVTEVVE